MDSPGKEEECSGEGKCGLPRELREDLCGGKRSEFAERSEFAGFYPKYHQTVL